VDLVGGEDLLGRHVAQAQVADLALGHELAHRADGLLHGDARVGEVQVPEVQHIHAEAAQGGLRRGPRPLRARVHEDLVRVGRPHPPAALSRPDDPPLGRDDGVVAAPGEGAPDELLVVAVAVGGVDEAGSAVQDVAQGGQARRLVAGAVEADEDHRAVADRRDGEGGEVPGGVHGSMVPSPGLRTNRTHGRHR
jgi:hypothetical protein